MVDSIPEGVSGTGAVQEAFDGFRNEAFSPILYEAVHCVRKFGSDHIGDAPVLLGIEPRFQMARTRFGPSHSGMLSNILCR